MSPVNQSAEGSIASSLFNSSQIIGNLAIQIGAIFAVDALGQTLGRRLHDQRLLVADLIEQLGEGVVAIDRRGFILYSNDIATELLEVPQGLSMDVRLTTQLAQSGSAEVVDLLERSDLPVLERVQTVGGRMLAVRVGFLRGRGQRMIGRHLMVADQTRLLDLEADAARGEGLAAMGQMAAGIAHEVRNPLASLRGCVQELGSMAQVEGQDDAVALSRIVVKEADRLERIVGEFLSLARERPPQQRSIVLQELVAQIIEMVLLRQDLPAWFRVESQLDDQLPLVWVDPDQLHQVILNVLVNAIEAFPRRPTSRPPIIEITAERDTSYVHLTISDSGQGIEPERLSEVFTPFHSSKSQGTGLGLTLVDRIMREHKGRVRITSRLGQGTQVRLSMPLADVALLQADEAIHIAAG